MSIMQIKNLYIPNNGINRIVFDVVKDYPIWLGGFDESQKKCIFLDLDLCKKVSFINDNRIDLKFSCCGIEYDKSDYHWKHC